MLNIASRIDRLERISKLFILQQTVCYFGYEPILVSCMHMGAGVVVQSPTYDQEVRFFCELERAFQLRHLELVIELFLRYFRSLFISKRRAYETSKASKSSLRLITSKFVRHHHYTMQVPSTAGIIVRRISSFRVNKSPLSKV
jgi:hypothetical protein